MSITYQPSYFCIFGTQHHIQSRLAAQAEYEMKGAELSEQNLAHYHVVWSAFEKGQQACQ